MSTKTFSIPALSRFLAIVVGLIVMAACGGGSTGTTTTTTTGTAAVTISGSTLTSNTLTFSSAVGVTSAAQTLTLTDSGTASVTFTSFTPSTGFSQINNCGTSIGPGGACAITVTFTPTASGTTNGSLSIVDIAGTQTVTLTGTAAVPAVSVSPPSLTFASQAQGSESSSQPVTLTNTGTVPLSITSIGIGSTNFTQTSNCGASLSTGSFCTINVFFTPQSSGTLAATLTISDNASTNPTVGLTGTGAAASAVTLSYNGSVTTSLSFTGVTVGGSSSPEVVTLDNTGSTALAISSIAVTAGSANFSETNNCGTGLNATSTCTINVTFTPQAGGTLLGTLTLVDSAGTQTLSLSGSGLANTVPVTVGFGPNGYIGPPTTTGSSYYNGIYTSVTVCSPGSTTNCTTIPNVLVDTGSVGLRVLSSGAVSSSGTPLTTQVSSLNLPQVTDSSSGTAYPLYECVQYGDLSYTWGPIQMANVQIGGETASTVPGGTANAGIPIQVISAGVTPNSQVGYEGGSGVYYNPCLLNPSGSGFSGGLNDDTVTNLGANGILGIGNFSQDCGTTCTSVANTTGQYLACTSVGSSNCSIWTATLAEQAWNPVATFPTDNNGVSISLPTVPAAGQLSVPANGQTATLTFGIGTEPNNGLNGATIYTLDNYANFASATLNGITYCTSGLSSCPTSEGSGGTFIDSGTNALYVSDAVTLSTSDCYQNDIVNINNDLGWYCPSPSPLTLQLTLTGANNNSSTVSLNIANANNLFAAPDTLFAAFNNLGGPSCIAATGSPCTGVTPSPDYFDLGLPFFFGRPVFVGIAGTSVGSTTYPNGFWAF